MVLLRGEVAMVVYCIGMECHSCSGGCWKRKFVDRRVVMVV